MNEELYLDMCLMLAPHVRTSAKRLLSGFISPGEFETIGSILATYVDEGLKGANMETMQYSRLSVAEPSYYITEQSIPFGDFLTELQSRMDHDYYMRVTFMDICKDVSHRLGIDAYQLAHGNVTEHQKMSIRLTLSQLEGYQPGQTELFMSELKKKKDNQ